MLIIKTLPLISAEYLDQPIRICQMLIHGIEEQLPQIIQRTFPKRWKFEIELLWVCIFLLLLLKISRYHYQTEGWHRVHSVLVTSPTLLYLY